MRVHPGFYGQASRIQRPAGRGVSQPEMSLRRRLIAAACLGIALSVASNNGLCVLEARILDDEDYFRTAIHEVISDPVGGVAENVPGGSIFKEVRTQRYANPDDFLGENPKCCRFVPANSGDG